MRRIIESSLNLRYLFLAIAIAMAIYGIMQIPKMPVDALPEFEAPMIEIQTEAVGLSAEEVESLVTLNVEEFLNGVPWLQSITSESIAGLSSIKLIFEPGTDLMRARQVVQESLSLVYTMPNVSKPPVMLQPLSTTRRAMMVGLSSKTLSPIEISVLAQWTIKPRLLSVPGVANVVIWGKKNRELQVLIDPKRLKEFNLTQEQIIKTAGEALWVSQLSFLESSLPGTGGWIDTPNQRLGIRHQSPISKPEDLANLPIEGTKYRLGDVTKIVEGHQPLVGETYLDGDKGIMLIVEKFPNADTLEVTRGVEKSLQALQLGLPGLTIDTNYFRLSNYIENALSNIEWAFILGLLLLTLTLFFFFYSWRAVVIILTALLLSFILALLILYWQGATLNLMVLAGLVIALGMVINDQMSGVENIVKRLREQNPENRSPLLTLIPQSFNEITKNISFATLIMIVAILPIYFMVGTTGAFFHSFALAYIAALVSSLVVLYLIVPPLSFLFFENAHTNSLKTAPFSKMDERYEAIIQKPAHNPIPLYAIAAVIILASLIALPFFKKTFLPSFRDRDLLIEMDGGSGMSHQEITRIVDRITTEIRTIPGIKRVVAHSGHAITGDQIVSMNSSKIWASIDEKANFNQTIDAVNEVVEGYQGLDRDTLTYLTEIARDAFPNAKEDIVIRLYGSNQKTLLEKAENLKQELATIPEILETQIEGQVIEPHIEVKVDMEKAAPHGIKPGDARRAASTIFAGITVGNLFENQKIFDVVVWGDPSIRKSLKAVQDVLIDKPGGGYVRLGDVANVSIVSGPALIRHESISPYIDVVARVNPENNFEKTSQKISEHLKKIKFPLEYHPEIFGEYTESKHLKHNLLLLGFAATLVIYFLLQACFNSWTLALLAFVAAIVALAGGILANVFNGGIFSYASLFGLLAVMGIAIKQIITLISHRVATVSIKERDSGSEKVVQGAQSIFLPILLPTLATISVMLPFVFFGNVAGLEILHPMAIVVIGGLITSTLFTLFLVPLLYLIIRRR